MFYLIGLGLGKGDLPYKALDVIKQADIIFYDTYTNLIDKSYISELEQRTNQHFKPLHRQELESESVLLDPAKEQDVVLLVSGDPLISTTHFNLILSCNKLSIPYKVFHATSIQTAAIGESGLSNYKFGRSTTIVFFRKNFRPTSFYDIIIKNLDNDLHSLIFLDIDKELGAMDPYQAITTLMKIDEQKLNHFNFETKVLILSRIGYTDQSIEYLSFKQILSKDFSKPPYILILPAKLSPVESENLSIFSKV